MSAHTDNNNRVYVNANGKRVMRVTEVIRRLSKDQIVFWANMLGFKGVSYKKELERTANIGSMGHDIIEKYIDPRRIAEIDFEHYGIYDKTDRQEAMNVIHSLIKWYKKVKKKFKLLHTEFTVVGETLGGTIDCIIEDWDDPDKVIFVDWKSSGFYLTQFLQLIGYVLIYEEVYGKNKVGGVMVVAADKKHGNRAQAKLLRRKDMKLYFHMFRALFEMAYYEKVVEGCFMDHLEDIG